MNIEAKAENKLAEKAHERCEEKKVMITDLNDMSDKTRENT